MLDIGVVVFLISERFIGFEFRIKLMLIDKWIVLVIG